MTTRLQWIVLATLTAGAVIGCSASGSNAPATPEQKKAFSGGPMPPEARKQFEDSQKQSAQRIADAKAKAAANAGH